MSADHHLGFKISHPILPDDSTRLKTQASCKPALGKDFSKMQSFHQNDYDQLLRWWEQLELSQQPQEFRRQPMKWFTWSMAVVPELQFSVQRIEISKVIALVYIIDDIFDLHGSLEELTLFTQAVERWDNSQLILDSLPTYMKFCLHALFMTTEEIADLIMKKHGLNRIDSLRKLWASLLQAFLVEAQWFRCKSPPKAKEYLENAIVSTGFQVVLGHLNLLLGNEGNRKNIALLDHDDIYLLFSKAALIFRLWDDFGSAKDENQNGFDGSYIDYYMKERDVSLQAARKHTNQMISNAWRELNEEILSESQVSSTMKKAILNLVSMMKVIYKYDNQRLPVLED